jgi:murein DD-endopeptidase MepM/ murein hydrolase activator NlpD
MNLIFFNRLQGRARCLNLAHPLTLVASVAAVGLLVGGTFYAGMKIGAYQTNHQWQARIGPSYHQQQAVSESLRQQLQDRIDALALKTGTLDANLMRLNALGKRLAEMAGIKSSEFDFDRDPPQGGPESGTAGRGVELAVVDTQLTGLQRNIDFRTAQLSALEKVLLGRQLSEEILPTGRPVTAGYISSGFGERMDPFDGEEAFHKGVDFAAAAGSDVSAVATGIVTWAGLRNGYGMLVEISHGNGLVTRYAHNAKVLVNVGETVQRGQAVAIVGSTGRSTGPHVHFEVLKNNVAVNPVSFIDR